jgi:hypothetical protein
MSPEQLEDVKSTIERMTDPVYLTFINAPEDDEPTTAEDLEALAEAEADAERGETVSLEAVMAESAAPTKA